MPSEKPCFSSPNGFFQGDSRLGSDQGQLLWRGILGCGLVDLDEVAAARGTAGLVPLPGVGGPDLEGPAGCPPARR
ncbi:hypothetical protein ATKI12_7259 [Kitasatospora sp. Ki12]